MSLFKKATRSHSFLNIALTGPSGSGKTLGALLIASGMGGKIAVIDTENGSASLYSDRFNFDVLEISPPFTTEKYIAAIKGAADAGYAVLIIDSISHAWSGEGGLLQQKEQLDQRGGNSYTNWAKITPKHEAFMASILHSKVHLIATMRSKQDYVLVDKNGKQVPQKVGLAPIQRDGAEYEFTTVLDIAMNHEAVASKDRTGLFENQMVKISEDIGKRLMAYLGATPQPPQQSVRVPIEGTIPNGGLGGEFFIDFGPDDWDFKGHRVKDIAKEEMAAFLLKQRDKASKEGKPLSTNLTFLKVNFERFLKESEKQ